MNAISSCCSNMPAYGNSGAISKNAYAAQYSKLVASSSQSKDITLYTDEGDKVTLSYNQESSLTYANLKAMSYGFDYLTADNQEMVKETQARFEAEMFGFNASRDFTLSVEGDLNEQELADIKAAMAGIDEIMMDLLNGGNISEAMADAEEIRDLDTIAGLEAAYKFERSILTERTTVLQTESVAKNNIPENIATPRHGHRGEIFRNKLDNMAALIENSHTDPSRLLNHIKKMIETIQNRYEEDTPIHRAKKHVADLIRNELVDRIDQMAKQNSTIQDKNNI